MFVFKKKKSNILFSTVIISFETEMISVEISSHFKSIKRKGNQKFKLK